MRFFKHFTDAHRGSSLKFLEEKHGMAGVGRYWAFVEMCAEKMVKNKDEEFGERHCVFRFTKSSLAKNLGYKNHKHLMNFLTDMQAIGLCSLSDGHVIGGCSSSDRQVIGKCSPSDLDSIIVCSMPKLLECIDRDSKRARTERAASAPKIKNKIKIKKKSGIVKINDANDLVNAIGNEGIEKILELFPQDLVDYEFPFMAIWLKENGPKRNYLTFVVNWLKRAQKDRDQELARQTKVDKTMGLVVA